jgi:hypothetical protein
MECKGELPIKDLYVPQDDTRTPAPPRSPHHFRNRDDDSRKELRSVVIYPFG